MTDIPALPSDLPATGHIVDGVHRLGVRVYYEDTDFTGMVYHAGYLRFFERGRSELLRAMNAEGADPGAFAVTRIEVDYLKAARIHDALLVTTRFTGIAGVRLGFAQEIYRQSQILARAIVTAVPITAEGRVRRPTAADILLWDQHKGPAKGAG